MDGSAASVAVRHIGPGVPSRDVVISTSRGACQSTALLAPEPLAHAPRGWFGNGDGHIEQHNVNGT
jgi:hypothetical protein